MGREMHRKGSNVLLCFRQCGHVRDDLKKKRTRKRESKMVGKKPTTQISGHTNIFKYYTINTHKAISHCIT